MTLQYNPLKETPGNTREPKTKKPWRLQHDGLGGAEARLGCGTAAGGGHPGKPSWGALEGSERLSCAGLGWVQLWFSSFFRCPLDA